MTVLRRQSNADRLFPMGDGPPLPWPVAEAIYGHTYYVLFGGQTLERLAERGGGGYGEIAYCWKRLTAEQKARARDAIAELLPREQRP
jgi:hypothetical protein